MDYGTLRSNVESAMGRNDLPSYIYTLATADINRDCRFLDMEKTGTVTTSANPAALPANFHSLIAISIGAGGDQLTMEGVTAHASAPTSRTGLPRRYSIRDDGIYLSPPPDGDYTLNIQYIEKLADLSADGDTNDVMTRYPGLYLYLALTHAAIWAKDEGSLNTYGSAYASALRLAQKDDMQRRHGIALVSRNARL